MADYKKVGDQHGKKTYGTLVVDVKKKKKKNKGKSVQVEDLEDVYVKNQFGIYVLNPKLCSSNFYFFLAMFFQLLEHLFEPGVYDAGAS